MGIPGANYSLQKIIMVNPKWAEAERDRAKVLVKSKLKKDRIMVRSAVREDFGGGL